MRTAEQACKEIKEAKENDIRYALGQIIRTVVANNGSFSWQNFDENLLGVSLGENYEQRDVKNILECESKLTELGYKVTVEKSEARDGIFGKKFEKTKVTVSACCGEE